MARTSKIKSTKETTIEKTTSDAAIAKVKATTLEEALKRTSEAQASSSKVFAELQAALVSKYGELEAVEQALTTRRKELEELHGKDQMAMSIDELETQLQAKKEATEQELIRLGKAADQAAEDLEEERAREQAEFDYNLSQKRKADEDVWQEKVRNRQRDEKIRVEEFERDLKRRQDEMKAKEEDYNKALTRFSTIDKEIETAAAKQTAIATATLRKEHEHSNQLAQMQHDSALRELQSANDRYRTSITEKDARIKVLEDQLRAALDAQISLGREAVAAGAAKQQAADLQSLFTATGGGSSQRAKS